MFTTSAPPGYPIGPTPRITRIEFSSMLRLTLSIFLWKSSGPSNTTAFPSKEFGLFGLERYLSLNSALITDVFIIALSKRLPLRLMKPELLCIGLWILKITSSFLLKTLLQFSAMVFPLTVIASG